MLIVEAFKEGCKRIDAKLFVHKGSPEAETSVCILEQSIYYVAGGPEILRQLSTSRKASAHEKQADGLGRFTSCLPE